MSLSEYISHFRVWLSSPDNPWYDRMFLLMVGGIIVCALAAWAFWEMRVSYMAPSVEFDDEDVVSGRRVPASGFHPQGYRGPRRPGDHARQRSSVRVRELQSR